jgi:hypothetical protein
VVGIGAGAGEGGRAGLIRVHVDRKDRKGRKESNGSAVFAVSAFYRRMLARELETIGSLNSIVRPLRNTLTVAVDPIGASATRRENCDGSSI